LAGNHKRRKRKVDVSTMTPEQQERLKENLGKQLAKIMDEANTKANKLLKIYGLETVIRYNVQEMGKNEQSSSKL